MKIMKPEGYIQIMSHSMSYGTHPVEWNVNRKSIEKSQEQILDTIGIDVIERYLRKKKLEKINKK